MDKNQVVSILADLYDTELYQLFEDGIISEDELCEFVWETLESYHHGSHEVEIVTGHWTFSCYHRCVCLSNNLLSKEYVIETLDALFYGLNFNQYDDIEELKCDVLCFIELFNIAYCRMMGYETPE